MFGWFRKKPKPKDKQLTGVLWENIAERHAALDEKIAASGWNGDDTWNAMLSDMEGDRIKLYETLFLRGNVTDPALAQKYDMLRKLSHTRAGGYYKSQARLEAQESAERDPELSLRLFLLRMLETGRYLRRGYRDILSAHDDLTAIGKPIPEAAAIRAIKDYEAAVELVAGYEADWEEKRAAHPTVYEPLSEATILS